MAPGHCYRLYSAAVFQQQFPQWDTPEICRTPLEDTLLLMKDMGIKNVETFPFPTLPEQGSIQAALQILVALGAVDKNKEISTLGRAMMKYPVGVRYAKMLVLAGEKKEILGLMGNASASFIIIPPTLFVYLFPSMMLQRFAENCSRVHVFSSTSRLNLVVARLFAANSFSISTLRFCSLHMQCSLPLGFLESDQNFPAIDEKRALDQHAV